MTTKLTFAASAALVGILLPAVALPVGAFGQTQPPAAGAESQTTAPSGGSTSAPAATPGHRTQATAAKPASRAERVEQHIRQLHAELQITPAQQAEWEQFAQVMRDNAKDMDQALDQREKTFASMNAVENLQSYAQVAQQHAQDTEKLATAFQTLYGSMSDDQKKNADAVFKSRHQQARHEQGHHQHG